MFSLKDKVALITGASQGIGRDTALALSEAGAKVAVAARNEEKLASLVAEIESAGGASPRRKDRCSRRRPSQSLHSSRSSKNLARLDILVNNAAITQRRPVPAHETRRLGSRPPYQPDRRPSLHPASDVHHDARPRWAHHQHQLRSSRRWATPAKRTTSPARRVLSA